MKKKIPGPVSRNKQMRTRKPKEPTLRDLLQASINEMQQRNMVSAFSYCEMLEIAYDFSEITMKHVLTQSTEFERQRMVLCSREIGELLRDKYDLSPFEAGAAMLVGGMEFIKKVHDEQHGG